MTRIDNLIRVFTGVDNYFSVVNKISRDIDSSLKQLASYHQAHYHLKKSNQLSRMVGADDVYIFVGSSIPSSKPKNWIKDTAKFAIPIYSPKSNSSLFKIGDRIIITNNSTNLFDIEMTTSISNIETTIFGTHKLNKTSQFTAQIRVNYSNIINNDIPQFPSAKVECSSIISDQIVGYCIIEIYNLVGNAKSGDYFNIFIPFFSYKINIVKQNKYENDDPLTKNLLIETGTAEIGKTIELCNCFAFFDYENVSKEIADHVEHCLQENNLSFVPKKLESVQIQPFSHRRVSEKKEESRIPEPNYLGLSYVFFKHQQDEVALKYKLLLGHTMQGTINSNESIILASSPFLSLKSLYFSVSQSNNQEIQNLLSKAINFAEKNNIKFPLLLRQYEKKVLAHQNPIITGEEFEKKMISFYENIETIHSIHLWKHLINEYNFQLFDDRKKTSPIFKNENENEDENEVEYDDIFEDWETKVPQAETFLDDAEYGKNPFKSVVSAAEEFLRINHRNAVKKTIRLCDSTYDYDRVLYEEQTSMSICRELSNVLSVTFDAENVNEKDSVMERVREYSIPRTEIREIKLNYPLWSTKTTFIPHIKNTIIDMFFSAKTSDAAIVQAMLFDNIILNNHLIFINFKSMFISKLEKKKLKDIKYIPGKDPRLTPSWSPKYQDSIKLAFEGREDAFNEIVKIRKCRLTKAEAGLINMRSAFSLMMKAECDRVNEAYSTGKWNEEQITNIRFSFLETLDNFADAYEYLMDNRYYSQKIYEKCLEILDKRKHKLYIECMKSAWVSRTKAFEDRNNAKKASLSSEIIQKFEEEFGLKSKTYMKYCYAFIEQSKKLNISQETYENIIRSEVQNNKDPDYVVRMMVSYQNFNAQKVSKVGRIKDISLISSNQKSVAKITNEIYQNFMRSIIKSDTSDLIVEQAIEEMRTGKCTDPLDTTRQLNSKRYYDMIEIHKEDDRKLSTADRIWALNYERESLEKGFMTRTYFTSIYNEKQQTKTNIIDAYSIFKRIIKQNINLNNIVKEYHITNLSKYYNRLARENVSSALLFVKNFTHWIYNDKQIATTFFTWNVINTDFSDKNNLDYLDFDEFCRLYKIKTEINTLIIPVQEVGIKASSDALFSLIHTSYKKELIDIHNIYDGQQIIFQNTTIEIAEYISSPWNANMADILRDTSLFEHISYDTFINSLYPNILKQLKEQPDILCYLVSNNFLEFESKEKLDIYLKQKRDDYMSLNHEKEDILNLWSEEQQTLIKSYYVKKINKFDIKSFLKYVHSKFENSFNSLLYVGICAENKHYNPNKTSENIVDLVANIKSGPRAINEDTSTDESDTASETESDNSSKNARKTRTIPRMIPVKVIHKIISNPTKETPKITASIFHQEQNIPKYTSTFIPKNIIKL